MIVNIFYRLLVLMTGMKYCQYSCLMIIVEGYWRVTRQDPPAAHHHLWWLSSTRNWVKNHTFCNRVKPFPCRLKPVGSVVQYLQIWFSDVQFWCGTLQTICQTKMIMKILLIMTSYVMDQVACFGSKLMTSKHFYTSCKMYQFRKKIFCFKGDLKIQTTNY